MGEALLDLIVVLVLSRVFWKLVGRAIVAMSRKARSTDAPAQGIHMVRDPVCGTFVVPDRAVTLVEGGQRLFFCSTACRDRYHARTA
jgi:YHS domain-containing protein